MLALRERLGTLECGNLLLQYRRSGVDCIFKALLDLILGTTKPCLGLFLLLTMLLKEPRKTCGRLRSIT